MSDHLKVVPFTGSHRNAALRPIEYRKPCVLPPDENGFYYAKETGFIKIEVVEVVGAKVFRAGAMSPIGLERFDWFGAVTEVREG